MKTLLLAAAGLLSSAAVFLVGATGWAEDEAATSAVKLERLNWKQLQQRQLDAVGGAALDGPAHWPVVLVEHLLDEERREEGDRVADGALLARRRHDGHLAELDKVLTTDVPAFERLVQDKQAAPIIVPKDKPTGGASP